MTIEELKELVLFAKDNQVKSMKFDGLEFVLDERSWIKPIETKAFTLPEEQKQAEEKLNEQILFWSA